MNTLSYQQPEGARWQRPMPTFLIDGEDLLLTLLGDSDLGVAGAGATAPGVAGFLATGRTIFHSIPDGNECRQVLLDMDLGDSCGSFITAAVRRSGQIVT
jgi:hypothetical protein